MASPKQAVTSRQTAAPIPFSLYIGVTGHRRLPDVELLRRSVDQVLSQLDTLLGVALHGYTVVSPLAEGADRLVAQQVLAWPGHEQTAELVVILPLPIDEYRRDFATTESQAEFADLVARAHLVRTASASAKRPTGYLRAGQQVVQGCDVLIGIWNGLPAAGGGGTAEIVAYARHIGRWMFWIHSEDGEIREENRPTTPTDTIARLSSYNSEGLDLERLNGIEANGRQKLKEQTRTAGLDASFLAPLWVHMLPQFVRTDLLAGHYLRPHNLRRCSMPCGIFC